MVETCAILLHTFCQSLYHPYNISYFLCYFSVQLNWLLKDEIASAMRLVVPVSAETLDMVAIHVKTSNEKRMCIMEQVPLLFVYGPDQSLQHFVEVSHSSCGLLHEHHGIYAN